MDMTDCGPGCLKINTKYYGKPYLLPYMRDKRGIIKEGVYFADLSYAAEA